MLRRTDAAAMRGAKLVSSSPRCKIVVSATHKRATNLPASSHPIRLALSRRNNRTILTSQLSSIVVEPSLSIPSSMHYSLPYPILKSKTQQSGPSGRAAPTYRRAQPNSAKDSNWRPDQEATSLSVLREAALRNAHTDAARCICSLKLTVSATNNYVRLG